MTDKIIFELKQSIKVQANIDGKNDFIDLDKIYLLAPSYKEKDKTLILKKKFLEAMLLLPSYMSRQEAQEQVNSDNVKFDAKTIHALLFLFKDFDIVSYHKYFANLLLNVAFKDEESKQPLTALDINKISEDDFEGLLAKYLEVFFIVSWTKTLN
jgi:hypothetical protein